MNWLALVAIAVIADSIRIFIDNYVSDVYFKGSGAFAQKFFYAFTAFICAGILFFISDFGLLSISLSTLLMLILSGIMSNVASIPYYKALEIDDSTNLGIFIQLAPVLYLVLGWAFLGETLSFLQVIAFCVILAAPILIVLTTRKRSRKTRLRAVFYSFLYVLIAVIANLIFVQQSTELDFLAGMTGLLIGKGIGAFLIFAVYPKWRRRFFQVVKKSKRRVLRPLIVNSVVGFFKDLAYRAALVVAPSVALASAASDSTEPIAIFFMGIVLTLVAPKFGREKLDSKTVFVHIIATVLVVVGIILLQF